MTVNLSGDGTVLSCTTTTGRFIVRVTKGYQFVMNVKIILINYNRNVSRTIVEVELPHPPIY